MVRYFDHWVVILFLWVLGILRMDVVVRDYLQLIGSWWLAWVCLWVFNIFLIHEEEKQTLKFLKEYFGDESCNCKSFWIDFAYVIGFTICPLRLIGNEYWFLVRRRDLQLLELGSQFSFPWKDSFFFFFLSSSLVNGDPPRFSDPTAWKLQALC